MPSSHEAAFRSTAVSDVIIVGGGAIGMTTALALQARGLRCTLIERGTLGAESSWAGGGILAPLRPWHYPQRVWDLVARSRALYAELQDGLQRSSGVDIELLHCGATLLDSADFDLAREWHARVGLPCENTHCGNAEAIAMPWVQQVRNPRLIRALRGAMEASGIPVWEQTPVQALCRDGDRVTGVHIDQGALRAPHTVVAAGAWSGHFSESVSARVRPMRGQMLRLEPASDHPSAAGIWLLPEAYVIVRGDGTTLLGSTVEDAGYDKSVTPEARERLLRTAASYLPWIKAARVVDHWAGLRPGSANGEPIIGADPALRGLWWNTGHFRTGLAMAPASAEELAEAIRTTG
ncbi:NAD(P)/FAD-dependent oxidoreductase [Algiphilus sp.]|uniref:NAD(P)/FAD-dependent oxidoreductase n=1 Tax=Algiphilus sp. TaxID=1872431 RepID=UPI003B52452D